MDPKGKGIVINDKKESFVNEPKDDKPTDSGSGHRRKDGKKKKTRRIKEIVYYDSDESTSSQKIAIAFEPFLPFSSEKLRKMINMPNFEWTQMMLLLQMVHIIYHQKQDGRLLSVHRHHSLMLHLIQLCKGLRKKIHS